MENISDSNKAESGDRKSELLILFIESGIGIG